MLEFSNYKYSSTSFNVCFKNKINLLLDNSGTGKTFMIGMLNFYCREKNIACTHVDYTHRNMPLTGRVLLFDKADLYLTPEMFENLKELDATSIISIKSTVGLNLFGDVGIYRLINSKGTEISTEKCG